MNLSTQFGEASQTPSNGFGKPATPPASESRSQSFLGGVHGSRNGMPAVGVTTPDQEKTPAQLNPLTFDDGE
ncbi:hypothetical protein GCM10015535_36120 [Streptomyces gelaticus]|uniref:Uncharacterized protein n=1 Tax=Streptomyces gelaticus TaxID=285446 RepID=A0ABQ2VZU2_9ACTN|nr:hypothetical protein GCM10015535_36120 [Streptomyces gelaticus]